MHTKYNKKITNTNTQETGIFSSRRCTLLRTIEHLLDHHDSLVVVDIQLGRTVGARTHLLLLRWLAFAAQFAHHSPKVDVRHTRRVQHILHALAENRVLDPLVREDARFGDELLEEKPSARVVHGLLAAAANDPLVHGPVVGRGVGPEAQLDEVGRVAQGHAVEGQRFFGEKERPRRHAAQAELGQLGRHRRRLDIGHGGHVLLFFGLQTLDAVEQLLFLSLEGAFLRLDDELLLDDQVFELAAGLGAAASSQQYRG